MTTSRRTLLTGATATLASACSTPPAAKGEALKFSILSTENSASQAVKWTPFLADLSKLLGREIKPFYAVSYTPLVEAMRFKQTDAGWFSNQSGLEAVRRSGGEVFASTTHPGGARGYHSVIIVKKGRGLTLESLLKCDHTMSFGMGDAKSTSGTLAPHAYLFGPRNIDPQTCFKTVRSGSHEANLMSVANGVVDAATNNTNDFERLRRRKDTGGAKALDQIEVVWTSPTLPEDPVIWRRDLDPGLKQTLRQVLLAYGTGAGAAADRQRAILTDLNFGPFQPADDRHLLAVRELEAADLLLRAKRAGDRAKIGAARADLDRIRLEARPAG